jgi:hypothetical protein
MVQHGPILITRAHVDVKPLRAELPTSTSRRCYGIRCTRDTRSNVQSVSVSRRQPRPHGGLSHGQQHRETDQEANKRRHCNFLLFGTQAGQRAHHTVLARAGTQPVAGPHARGWPHWSRPDAPPRTGGWAGSVRFNPLLRGATSATRDAELGHPLWSVSRSQGRAAPRPSADLFQCAGGPLRLDPDRGLDTARAPGHRPPVARLDRYRADHVEAPASHGVLILPWGVPCMGRPTSDLEGTASAGSLAVGKGAAPGAR